MRAAIMRQGRLVVDQVGDPRPAEGQMLVRTLACGICGSDLHALSHGRQMVELSRESGIRFEMDVDRDVIMGHEFCGEVVELGPGAEGHRPGDVVVAMPLIAGPGKRAPIGYSNEYPGGYGELLLVSAGLSLRVPNGLDPHIAALTEPMAVGRHAVARGRMQAGGTAIVLGCGPVGLAVIAALAADGVEVIVASDFSVRRRELASSLGATTVIDAKKEDSFEAWRRLARGRPVTIFECVGIPGMINASMRGAPRGAHIVVVGVCMEPDHFRPIFGINKELSLTFVYAYDFPEFQNTLSALAEGTLRVSPMITGKVSLDEVPAAFEMLRSPDTQAKVLVTF